MKKQLELLSELFTETLTEIGFHSNDDRISDELKLHRIRTAVADVIGRKVCAACEDIKRLDEFKLKHGTFDGRAAVCEVCRLERGAKWREKHRDKLNAKARERIQTPEGRRKARERKKKWRMKNLAHCRAYHRNRYHTVIKPKRKSTAGDDTTDGTAKG